MSIINIHRARAKTNTTNFFQVIKGNKRLFDKMINDQNKCDTVALHVIIAK